MIRILAFILIPTLAMAQAAPDQSFANSQYASLVPLLVIFAIFYILLIRPQQKRMKEHQIMLGALAKGDAVVTAGGIVGKITKAEAGDTFSVEIAKGAEVSVVKSTISTVLGKPAVAKPAAPEKKKGANRNDNSAARRDNVANDN